MKKLLWKIAIILFPFFLVLMAYVITDPRKKIYHYEEYPFEYIMLNKGDVSTRLLLQNVARYHYDSFIFGSSRSCATRSEEWKKYLRPANITFSYGSWSESLKGIYRKIVILDSLNIPVRNALIVIDVTKTFENNKDYDPINSDHYLISGMSKFDYYKSDFLEYLRDPKLIITSIDYYLFHTRRGYMSGFVEPKYGGLNSINCDWRVKAEELIVADSANYYDHCRHLFYQRPKEQVYAGKQITPEMKEYLLTIKRIFDKHQTNYQLLIAPLYDQVKLNQEDMSVLTQIFDETVIFDYSGINHITNNIYNYGEDVDHYRIRTGDMLLKDIYTTNTFSQFQLK